MVGLECREENVWKIWRGNLGDKKHMKVQGILENFGDKIWKDFEMVEGLVWCRY